MRGTHMVALENAPMESANMPATTPTYFNKLHLSTLDSNWDILAQQLTKFQEVNSIRGTTLSQPLLALALGIKSDAQKLVWTMSFNELNIKGASGLVVKRMTNSQIHTYFSAPPRDKDGSVDPQIKLAEEPWKMAYNTSQALMEASSRSHSIEQILLTFSRVQSEDMSLAFGGHGVSTYSELGESYSLYNWEFGFHIAMLLIERILSTQQFELGLQVANLVFDPWEQGFSAQSTSA
ncbi:hypothetical protein ACHAP5_011937 [Fusarium lateritium]